MVEKAADQFSTKLQNLGYSHGQTGMDVVGQAI
jgi:hypothetical protein